MSESILMVDDNGDNLALTRFLLEAQGFAVRSAENAAQALDILQTYRPNLILMDIQLPEMDGLELTRRLRQNPALDNVPIVALSAYAMKIDQENAHTAGCQGYITKPIDTRTFVSEVQKYLAAPMTPGVS